MVSMKLEHAVNAGDPSVNVKKGTFRNAVGRNGAG
jgi:hypothetical protein